jgi:1-acyl-sn-glycerol-3-phosphate acyltransferase
MEKLIAWSLSAPFLLLFSIVMVGFDLLMRIGLFFTAKAYELVLALLCRSVLLCLKVTGFSWHVVGAELLETLPKDLPLVVVSNHQSLMDIPMLYLAFPKKRLRFVAKRELAKNIPFVSISLRRGEHAIIDRDDRKRAIQQLEDFASAAVAQKFGVCIFPEGTRARTGQMKPFRTAGLAVILKTFKNSAVIPVSISNSWKLARYKMMPVPIGVKVTIRILDPLVFDYQRNVAEFIEGLQEQINSSLDSTAY